MASTSLLPRLALALSGGGFRATLFHLGALRRLNELGILSRIQTFGSVSGGSITNGVLATRWKQLLASEHDGVFTRFDELIREPLHHFCQSDLRTEVLFWDRVNPINWPSLLRSDRSITDQLVVAYGRHLSLDVPLAMLPSTPQFVFCCTNLERGACWRFKAQEMGDYDVGWGPTGDLTVAYAVAASSAYPVAFPPLRLKIDPMQFRNAHFADDPRPEIVTLTDGGVYDNLGLEPLREQHDFLLVSDAGCPLGFLPMPELAPYGRVARSLDVIWNQVGALRKRWLIDTFAAPQSKLRGTYWGLPSKVESYEVAGAPAYSPEVLALLTNFRTDLDSFTVGEIGCLENHGYALANVAIHRWTPELMRHPAAPFVWPAPDYATAPQAMDALRHSAQRGVLADLWNSLTRRVAAWV